MNERRNRVSLRTSPQLIYRIRSRATAQIRCPRVLRVLVVLAGTCSALRADDPPKKSVKVNFDSNAVLTASDGAMVMAMPSTLNAAGRAAVLAKIQAKFDAPPPLGLGVGRVNVAEGSGGDVDIVISGGMAPPTHALEIGVSPLLPDSCMRESLSIADSRETTCSMPSLRLLPMKRVTKWDWHIIGIIPRH